MAGDKVFDIGFDANAVTEAHRLNPLLHAPLGRFAAEVWALVIRVLGKRLGVKA